MPKLRTMTDNMIMTKIIAHKWKAAELWIINECQMALRVATLSDLVYADGRTLHGNIWNGTEECQNYNII